MQKWRRDFIAPIFAKRDLNDVGEGIAIEDCADRISNVEHQYPEPAVNFIRARAASVGRLANAANGRQRSVDQTNDFAKFDLTHRPAKGVAAEFSASAYYISARLELREDLLKKFDRQFFFRGQLAYLQHWPAKLSSDAEINKGSERVFAAFGKFHRLSPCRAAVY